MENPKKQKFYLLQVELDLFGTHCLVQTFGSLITNNSKCIVEPCSSEKDARVKLTDIEYTPRQRGFIYPDLLPGSIKPYKPTSKVSHVPAELVHPDQLEFNIG